MTMTRITALLALALLCCTPALAQDKAEWPQDARDVAYAVAGTVTGGNPLDNITFAPGATQTMEGADGYYSEFDAGAIILTSYENLGTGDDYPAQTAGVLNLREPSGRQVGLEFLADYTVKGADITVDRCAVATASQPTLRLEVYLVPASVFTERRPKGADLDWSNLYGFVRDNALHPEDDAGRDIYYVITFVMNRLPADAEFNPIVSSEKRARMDKDNLAKNDEKFLDFQGWRVHLFAARFKPGIVRGRFYVNYYYTPGFGVPEQDRESILVARYDSRD